jgi:dihydrofolate synthase/folylpolyglutamate synthase
MNYQEAIEFIKSTYRLGSRPGLENITRLLELLGQPQHSFMAVHVAGTNGKGSTCAFIASILKEAGYVTGLYTSPHLERLTERIRVSGQEISQRDVGQITECVKKSVDIMIDEGYAHPTEFEIITAIGFEYFKRKQAEYAVLEVGMGGRLDATNVVIPKLSVITPIGIDHIDVLGSDAVSIAREKAGIVKKGVRVLAGPQKRDVLETLRGICINKSAPFLHTGDGQIENFKPSGSGQTFDLVWQGKVYENIRTSIVGRHQADNAALALAAGLELGIPEHFIREGISKTKWPGRMEVIRRKPIVLIDGAHNVEGAKALVEGLRNFFPGRKVLLIFGMLRDKEVERVAEILASYANRVVTVPPSNARAMDPETLKDIVMKYNRNVVCAQSVSQAMGKFMVPAADEMVVFSGSLYMIGEVRKLLPPEIF